MELLSLCIYGIFSGTILSVRDKIDGFGPIFLASGDGAACGTGLKIENVPYHFYGTFANFLDNIAVFRW